MKIKAKKSFKELGISNNYQGLKTHEFEALMRGEIIELPEINHFIKEHVEIIGVKNVKGGK